MSHINVIFWKHAENTDNHLYEIEEKDHYHSGGSSWRNNLRIEGMKGADNQIKMNGIKMYVAY